MRAAARLFAAFDAALLVVLTTVGAAAGDPGRADAGRARPGAGGLSGAQAIEFLRAHNAWRRRVGVLPLRWASDLAVRAQARAEDLAAHGCVIEHGPLPPDIGENLYQAGPLHVEGRRDDVFAATPTYVVNRWGAESADYSPEHDTCASNRQCGHYTQIVWAATQEVGCGMSVCPTLGQVWVCNYRPRGNVRPLR